MDRKKELKEQYKQLKPVMGLLAFQSTITGKHHLEASLDLKSTMNRTLFQLKHGSHPQKELQRDWNQGGTNSFEIQILDELSPVEDGTPKNYEEELEELRLMWIDTLTKKGISFY